MPYIKQEDRPALDKIVELIMNECDGDLVRGKLNYIIHKLYIEFEKKHGRKYYHMKNFEGELLMSMLEIYARRVYPYEKIKCRQNGDVI
jgi:hypothetical protein